AQAIAAEWRAQGGGVGPPKMPLTRLPNLIIHGGGGKPPPGGAGVAQNFRNRLCGFRPHPPHRPGLRGSELWEPILACARDTPGARFALAEGVTFLPQPEAAIAAARRAIPSDPWRLGAVHAIMTLTGSALIALALARGALTCDSAWTAAHVDEDWNMEQWGR